MNNSCSAFNESIDRDAVKKDSKPPPMYKLERKQFLPLGIDFVWDFFSDPANLDRITPPSLGFEIISGADRRMFAGQIIEYRIQVLPFLKQRWVTEITHCQDRSYFVDEQRLGPYRFWHHLHRFEEVESGVSMTDEVSYELPFGPIGKLVHTVFVKRRLSTIFNYRFEYMQRSYPAK